MNKLATIVTQMSQNVSQNVTAKQILPTHVLPHLTQDLKVIIVLIDVGQNQVKMAKFAKRNLLNQIKKAHKEVYVLF
jgi:hypothetical protein